MHVQCCKMGLFEDSENFSIGAHWVENVKQFIHVLPWPPNERSGTAGNISVCFRNYLLAKALTLWTPCWIGPDSSIEWAWRATTATSRSWRGCQTSEDPSRTGDHPFSEMQTCLSQGISPFNSSLEQWPILGFNVDFIGISVLCGSSLLLGGCFQMLHTFHDMSSFLESFEAWRFNLNRSWKWNDTSYQILAVKGTPHAENRENVGLHLFKHQDQAGMTKPKGWNLLLLLLRPWIRHDFSISISRTWSGSGSQLESNWICLLHLEAECVGHSENCKMLSWRYLKIGAS